MQSRKYYRYFLKHNNFLRITMETMHSKASIRVLPTRNFEYTKVLECSCMYITSKISLVFLCHLFNDH